jgi:cyclomaltodextrinase / maltogenic alpha-amylase / neopullulanase
MNLMLGNHDLARFGDLIERAGLGGPDTADYYARHRMAFTFMAAWSGPITYYYGEEFGAEVAGFSAKVAGACADINRCDDHVARNMVSIPGVNVRSGAVTQGGRDLEDFLVSLMTLRAATPALSSGARTHIYSDKDLYIDLKSSGDARYVLVMNIGTSPRQATLLPSALGVSSVARSSVVAGQIVVTEADGGLALALPALSAAIIKVGGG